MRPSIRVRTFVGTIALVAGLGTVASCGDGGTTVATEDGKVKVDKGKVTVESSEGTTTVGRGIPEDFPEGVPLLDEQVINGVKGADGGPFAWSVVMSSKRAVEDLSAEVDKAFTADGYRTAQSTDLADVSIRRYTKDPYDVSVTIARTGDGVTVTYLVKEQG